VSFPRHHVDAGLRHLRAADPVMGDLIERVGPFAMTLRRARFQSLARSILAQQISTSAATSIRRRLVAHLGGCLTAERLARESPERLRTAGVSPQKAGYLLDLSRKVATGEVRLDHLHRLSDGAVIEELTRVKGIGVWTAQMFLMFCLGRLDVFPHGDLGIRTALKNLYRLKQHPDEKTACRIASPWRPYATMASWYCWRSLELPDGVGE
jgi:DNA-3-methyladenine glycosylase II